MRKKIFAAVLVLLAAAALFLGNPKIRARRFVNTHREELEEAYQTGIFPARIGYKTFNLWDGEHPMVEFILCTRGDTYYGCYYSPDDVPLPFQNVAVDMVQSGQTDWSWQGEGDNHGMTSRMTDGWYYFEASF